MTIKEVEDKYLFKTVRLKDGRCGDIVHICGETAFVLTIGYGPKDWEDIDISPSDIDVILEGEELEEHYKFAHEEFKRQTV